MKIVHIHYWYSKGFGYTENMLPGSLEKYGHEVHFITTNTQIYWYESMYKDVYEQQLGPGITAVETIKENNLTIYRLPHYLFCPFKKSIHQFEEYGIKGLYQLIEKIKPDVIQTQGINLISTWYAAKYAKRNKIKLFTENHIHKSVFNQKNRLLKSLYNNINPLLRTINNQTVKCFPIAPDAEAIAYSYYKVPKKKITLQSLGVDTNIFYYKDRKFRAGKELEIRLKFGFLESDIVVLYTGRFTEEKNPLCLAKAINKLHNSGIKVFKGLFIGRGSKDYTNQILANEGCFVYDFQPFDELPYFYWSADIGVWPAQESVSQLDALSCGLPIILSNKVKVIERIEGCGLLYKEKSFIDLSEKLLRFKDLNVREKLGKHGSDKVMEKYSWKAIAKSRIKFYTSNE